MAVAGRWREVAAQVGLISPAGSLRPTIFAEMSALAEATGAINLGQGFPDDDGPPSVLEAAVGAIRGGDNQYPPGRGRPVLRRAIAEHQRTWYGLDVDPETEVLVTVGATEALTAAVLAFCGPGDEVAVLEPFYDSYAAAIAMAGAQRRSIRLSWPDYRLTAEALSAAVTPRTRLLLINSPHNPTGRVLDAAERRLVADLARTQDLLVVTDEVYEHLLFDDRAHVPPATLPGMAERTLTISSAGKTFSVTGWKIGWLHGPAQLVDAVATVKQYLTYVGGGPFQPAVAHGLGLPREVFAQLGRQLQARRDLLVAGLEAAGFRVARSEGGYFVIADPTPLGFTDGAALCRELPSLAGVVAVPVEAFMDPAGPDGVSPLVRFACCKRPEVIAEAASRLSRLGRSV